MIKDIKYNGYSANPSDYDCPDGDLAAAFNVLPEDNALKPMLPPEVRFSFNGNMKILYLQETSSYKHLIVYVGDSRRLIAIDYEYLVEKKELDWGDDCWSEIMSDVDAPESVTAIGNVLIASFYNALEYIRFNAEKDCYEYLGSRMPEIDLEFALKLNFKANTYTDLNLNYSENTDNSDANSEYWQQIYYNGYRLSYPDGNVHIGTPPFYPSDSVDVFYSDYFSLYSSIKADVQYKFYWLLNNDSVHVYGLYLLGKKAGSDVLEEIFNFSVGAELGSSKTVEHTFSEDYTDVCFCIVRSRASSLKVGGVFIVYQGAETAQDVSYIIDYTSENYTALTAKINKFINDFATSENRFIYPFFVRYGVRSFSGDYLYISQPVFLIPNSGYAPAVSYDVRDISNDFITVSAYLADIQCKLKSQISEKWLDLIVAIDIFASQPVWTYNQGKEFDESKPLFKYKSADTSIGLGILYKNEENISPLYGINYLSTDINRFAGGTADGFIEVSPRTDEEIRKEIKSIANFYLIKSIPADTLSYDSWMDVNLEDGVLDSLPARETLSDNIVPYKSFCDSILNTYNSRLTIASPIVVLPDPVPPSSCCSYIQNIISNSILIAYVTLITEEGKRVVSNSFSLSQLNHYGYSWYFYPDSRAKKLTLVLLHEDSYIYSKELELITHDFLNGSYWLGTDLIDFINFTDADRVDKDPVDPKDLNNTIAYNSALFLSEVNNPFAFNLENVVSIGIGEILGISSAAKALSQGQFGQFPLYAFTTEGVWAVEISSTGTYSAKQPVTRDVCINTDSITQLDSAVLFVTHRGIMLLSGADTLCISDILNNDSLFDISTLPKFDDLADLVGLGKGSSVFNFIPFARYIIDCRMIYDYTNQHIIVYNPHVCYAYVYSLKSKGWGIIPCNLEYHINSYPEALAIVKTQSDELSLVDFSCRQVNENLLVNSIIVTRPLKLDAPDILKTVDTVIQRGYFKEGHVKSVLYGSRDLFNWHLVHSSANRYLRGFRGTPYKYFRIVLICNLDKSERIVGATVNFEHRMTNRLR